MGNVGIICWYHKACLSPQHWKNILLYFKKDKTLYKREASRISRGRQCVHRWHWEQTRWIQSPRYYSSSEPGYTIRHFSVWAPQAESRGNALQSDHSLWEPQGKDASIYCAARPGQEKHTSIFIFIVLAFPYRSLPCFWIHFTIPLCFPFTL